MRLLVTLCNLPQTTSSPLLLVDTDLAQTRPIDIGARGSASGAAGLSRSSDCIYCAWIGSESNSYLSLLDPQTLAPVKVGKLENIHDVHSITVLDDGMYVVSTGADEVRRFGTRHPFGNSEVVWQASNAGRDTHHVNAILPVGGRIFCSAFGLKSGERWSTALDGYVVDIGSGQILWQGIEHPHSLAVGRGGFYVAESRRGRIRGLENGNRSEVGLY